jgi:hypothetical protein
VPIRNTTSLIVNIKDLLAGGGIKVSHTLAKRRSQSTLIILFEWVKASAKDVGQADNQHTSSATFE